MSWDKNTINNSAIDTIVSVLEQLRVEHKLTTEATVEGRGNNDRPAFEESRPYELRRLQYKDCVFLEQIEQDVDCDTDDIISSYRFLLSEEPEKWEYVVETDYNGIMRNEETPKEV